MLIREDDLTFVVAVELCNGLTQRDVPEGEEARSPTERVIDLWAGLLLEQDAIRPTVRDASAGNKACSPLSFSIRTVPSATIT